MDSERNEDASVATKLFNTPIRFQKKCIPIVFLRCKRNGALGPGIDKKDGVVLLPCLQKTFRIHLAGTPEMDEIACVGCFPQQFFYHGVVYPEINEKPVEALVRSSALVIPDAVHFL
jgi:hypothetical protein